MFLGRCPRLLQFAPSALKAIELRFEVVYQVCPKKKTTLQIVKLEAS